MIEMRKGQWHSRRPRHPEPSDWWPTDMVAAGTSSSSRCWNDPTNWERTKLTDMEIVHAKEKAEVFWAKTQTENWPGMPEPQRISLRNQHWINVLMQQKELCDKVLMDKEDQKRFHACSIVIDWFHREDQETRRRMHLESVKDVAVQTEDDKVEKEWYF